MLSTGELLQKAVFSVSSGGPGAIDGGGDFGGAGQAPLSVEQVTAFIELMAAEQVLLADVRTVTSGAAKWQESILDFGDRIARPGTEATRLDVSQRVKPATGIVEISTVLLRGEIPVSDETMEDNVAGQNLAQSLERTISSRWGYDVEDLMLNGDTGSSDPYYSLLDGWLVQCKNGKVGHDGTNVASGNAVDAQPLGQDFQEIFRTLLASLPVRYLRNIYTDGRFYIPKRVEIKYRDEIASRGTPLGDLTLTGTNQLTYQGIQIKGVPTFDQDVTNSASGKTGHVLLTNRNNLYAGFHRAMKFETWRDPREGATSFVITSRVDAEVAVPNATVVAYNVDCTA